MNVQMVVRHGPASHAQEGVWLACQAQPDVPIYNSAFALHLRGPLRVASIQHALARTVARHESLRTTFALVDGQLTQTVHEAPDVVLATASCPEPDLSGTCAAAAKEPFDLESGPLIRFLLLEVAADYAVLLLVVHHIAWDGASMRSFLRELSAGYEMHVLGRPDLVEPLSVQCLDHAERERASLTEDVIAGHLAFFRDKLNGLPRFLDLPTDRPRPAVRKPGGALRDIEFSDHVAAAIRALARTERTTIASVLLAGLQTVLARYADSDDIAVGIAVAQRPQPDLEPLIGFFVNTLVLRQRPSSGDSFRDLVRANRREIARCLDHQEIPFERLVRELAPDRRLDHHPLFQVMFSFQQRTQMQLSMADIDITIRPVSKNLAKFDLSLTLEADHDGGIGGQLSYSTDLFTLPTAERLATHLTRVLAAGSSAPDTRLDRIPMLSDAEMTRIRAAGPSAQSPPVTLTGLFTRQVMANPHATAVVDTTIGRTVTYQQLDHAADAVAATLAALDLPPEGRVAIAAELGIPAAAAVLGVLRASGAFFFCNPDYPTSLWHGLIAANQATAVLTTNAHEDRLAGSPVPVISLDRDGYPSATPDHRVPALLRPSVHPDQIACLSYTSGTTSEPKAVLLSHRSIAGYLLAAAAEHQLTGADRMVWKANTAFDAAVAELLQPLLLGASAVLLDPAERADPQALASALARHEITAVGLPAVLLRGLAHAPALPDCSALRLVTSGGESMHADVVRQFRAHCQATLVNRYGPCEASITVTSFDATHWAEPGAVPLGQARPGAEVYVLDRSGWPVPAGVVGEIHIGGSCLARGYAEKPALTARSFIPDRVSGRPGGRLYATGDWGRYRADGGIEFVRRHDAQVKIRGVRVEPAAITTALRADPAIRDAAVTVSSDPSGDRDQRVLIAHVETWPGAQVTGPDLRAELARTLPPFLVPAVVEVHERLPRTPTGKLDQAVLLAHPLRSGEMSPSSPLTATEQRLAEIWRDLLAVGSVPPSTSFFELGGHSLLAMQLINQVRIAFGREITLRHVLEQPTLRELAAVIVRAPRSDERLTIHPSPRRAQPAAET